MARLKSQFVFDHDYDVDYHDEIEREKKWLELLVEQLQSLNDGKLVGKELRWQRADGYARYIVVSEKPFSLSHLHIGDGYQVESALIRGLTITEAREQVKQNERISEIFSNGGK